MRMSKTFTLPDLGEGIHEAQIIRVMVQIGEQISEDQPLMEVETDKAAVEIPSPHAGIAKKIHVSEGQTITVGEAIVTFDGVDDHPSPDREGGGSPPPGATVPTDSLSARAPAGKPPVAPAAAETASPPAVTAPKTRRTKAAAAPAVRKMARDMGIDLDAVTGSGPGGRVTKDDLQRHAAPPTPTPSSAPAPAAPVAPAVSSIAPMPTEPPPGEVSSDKWGAIRTAPLTQIRKTIANRMKTSAFTIPHVTHGDEADVTELERARKRMNEATGGNPKLTLMPFVMRATIIALRKFPIFNASFDEENNAIIYKDYINLGIAVDTDRGLVVPNIRKADTLSLTGAALALAAISESARTSQFAIDDLRGGTFTITNVGPLGGTFSTPIINHPEVAILGLGRTRRLPVLDDNDEVKPATILPLFVAFDHRASDGLTAAKFTREIIGMLENPAMMLLY